MSEPLSEKSAYRPSTSVRKMTLSASSASASLAATRSAFTLKLPPSSPDGDGRDDRDEAVLDQVVDDGRVDLGDFADAAEPRVALLGAHEVAVVARDADREPPVGVDGGDELGVHLADEHHLDDLHGLVGRDAQAVVELDRQVEPVHVRR